MQLVPRLFFNRRGIGFKGSDFLLELLIVLRHRLNFLLQIGVFLLLAPQGQVAVAAEDFVHKQDKAQQRQHKNGVASERFVVPAKKIHQR